VRRQDDGRAARLRLLGARQRGARTALVHHRQPHGGRRDLAEHAEAHHAEPGSSPERQPRRALERGTAEPVPLPLHRGGEAHGAERLRRRPRLLLVLPAGLGRGPRVEEEIAAAHEDDRVALGPDAPQDLGHARQPTPLILAAAAGLELPAQVGEVDDRDLPRRGTGSGQRGGRCGGQGGSEGGQELAHRRQTA
jgi:hypothetical protein